VRACETLGFETPLDVRWCRMSHFQYEREQPEDALGSSAWTWFFHKSPRKEKTCTCGKPLPVLQWYIFTFVTDQMVDYHLGQCPRCRTIFWEEG